MKINLQDARVRPVGGGGFAQRTAAGFVVVGSADAGPLFTTIDANQTEPDLITKISEQVSELQPQALAMLFTGGGEVYLVAWGSAQLIIDLGSSKRVMAATPGRVLVEAVNLASDDGSVRMIITRDPAVIDDVVTDSPVDLQSGTVAADAVDVAVTVPASSPTNIKVDLPADDGGAVVAIAEPTPPPAAQEIAFADDVAPPPEPADAATQAVQAVDDPPPPPAPVEAPLEEVVADRDVVPVNEPVLVLGVSCAQGHHNHPDALYCSQCGTKMGVHQTKVFINGPRPPLGVLVVDDGTTFSLTSDLVIGREPGGHESIKAGTALPMTLSDETLSLSRRHAHIVLDEWSVFVADLGSSNGTWLNRPAMGDDWTQIGANHAMQLEPGDRLRVGGRIIQVELHHVR